MELEIEKCKAFEQFTFRHLTSIDIAELKTMILEEPQKTWDLCNQSVENQSTANIPIVHSYNDWEVNTPMKRFVMKPLYDKYMPFINPYLDFLHQLFPNSIATRIVFSKIFPKKCISPHVDFMDMIKYPRRFHIPIITNNDCLFTVGDETRVLEEGQLTLICQHTLHSVVNDGDTARIHLIIDLMDTKYVPSYHDVVIQDEFDEDGIREIQEASSRFAESLKTKYPWFILQK